MACCLAIAFVFATLRRMPGLRGGRDQPSHAPMARRPAPGDGKTAAAGPVRAPAAPRRRAATPPSGLLLGGTLGVVLYTLIVGLLFAGGVGESTSAAVTGRLTVSASLLVLAAVGLAVVVRRPQSLRAGRIVIGLGAAIELLSILDMHLLSPYELASGSPLVDVAFHATGPLIATAGLLLELRPLRAPRGAAIGAAR